MLRQIANNWWLIVLRGVLAVLFGVMAWAWPGLTIGALIILWAAYGFADGLLSFAAAFSGATGRPWWALTLEGLVSIAAAAAAIFFPGITTVLLLYVIAFWAIVTGVLEIVAAIQLRKEIKGEFWLALAGVGSLLFGVVLIARPAAGAIAVVWMLGVYAVLFGMMLIALGFRVKGMRDFVRAGSRA